MERQITLRITVEKPPAGVDFGLQKGRGRNYETVQKQRSGDGDLRFEFSVAVDRDSKAEAPSLRGPFVQGPADGQFVYLDIGTYAGQANAEWGRRLKIPFSGVAAAIGDGAVDGSHVMLETLVPGTGKDGGPNCGTVKPFTGWKLVKPSPAGHPVEPE